MATKGSFDDARAAIAEQHAEIHARLRSLDSAAVPDPSPLAQAYLRIALLRLAVLFDAHLTFEERTLGPRMLDIAREVSWLVVTLLEDMAREDRDIAELARLDEDMVFDQMTG